ncbi:MAG TPA: hypothetical protein VJT75_19765 [Thermoleophilaceae bacterium]|nr:hypothetical protein [Thermoleophilaceae bacterium]
MSGVPHEVASFEDAPRVLEGATDLELSPHDCNLDYWLPAVAQGTLNGLVRGHRPESGVPPHMLADGPLRDAMIDEMAFRSMAEEAATRMISYLVAIAPDLDSMEFYATQLVDEARHSRVFRDHIVELGVPEDELFETMERYSGADRDRVLEPLNDFAQQPVYRAFQHVFAQANGTPIENLRAADVPGLQWMRLQSYVSGVVILTILVEGVLAPFAELSERKWRPLDPAAADIERGANIDEIRHLSVGSWVVRRHLLDHPDDRQRVLELITAGRRLWEELPVAETIFRREVLFQQGLEQHADAVGDYEVWDGRRLVDTTAEERLETVLRWSSETQDSRLEYMGLPEAKP